MNVKKLFLGLVVASSFVIYALHGRSEAEKAAAVVPKTSSTTTTTQPSLVPSSGSGGSGSSAGATPATVASKYKDGTYVGDQSDALYGYIQVQAIIQGGKLADVVFLQYPNDRSTSRSINTQAMPSLKQEAIQAQSAQVDGVSGATDTSQAFIQSLSSALVKAQS